MYKYLLIIYKLYMFVAYIHSLSIYICLFLQIITCIMAWPGTHPDYYMHYGFGLGPIQILTSIQIITYSLV